MTMSVVAVTGSNTASDKITAVSVVSKSVDVTLCFV